MSPFNIKIEHAGKEITLTIIPENDYFKIVYFGAIVGAIRKVETDRKIEIEWELVEADEVEPGNLPWYDYKQSYTEDEPEFNLQLPEINRIAGAIENELS
jgi:hypothetical protein